MKFDSLTSRLIATTLCMELALAVFVTGAALYRERRETIRTFDIMLHGRADSVLGSVQDAEDAGDNVMLDKSSMHVPEKDVYEVREENGKFLGSSSRPQDQLSSRLQGIDSQHQLQSEAREGEAYSLKFGRDRYRAIALHGLRLIDPDEPGTAPGGKGTLHRIVVYYAAPSQPVSEAVWRAARFFFLADAVALLLSVSLAAVFIRRGLRPLDALAAQAGLLSPISWNFQAPPSAYAVSELAPLASALELALKRLKTAYQQQRTFVNDAAHELKTAVTVLKSSLQLLAYRDRSKNEYVAGIEGCLSDCGRMEELVQRMLLLARVEQAEVPQSRASGAGGVLAEVVRQTLVQLESAASLRRVILASDITDDRSTLLSEEDCTTLLSNLVMNALQHSVAGSTILVCLAPENASATKLKVIDQGEGIAAEHLPLVFDRFYRTDASRSRDTGGTGLGLAICKAIVESNGGSIQMESTLGHGTTVTLIIPVALLPELEAEKDETLNATSR